MAHGLWGGLPECFGRPNVNLSASHCVDRRPCDLWHRASHTGNTHSLVGVVFPGFRALPSGRVRRWDSKCKKCAAAHVIISRSTSRSSNSSFQPGMCHSEALRPATAAHYTATATTTTATVTTVCQTCNCKQQPPQRCIRQHQHAQGASCLVKSKAAGFCVQHSKYQPCSSRHDKLSQNQQQPKDCWCTHPRKAGKLRDTHQCRKQWCVPRHASAPANPYKAAQPRTPN